MGAEALSLFSWRPTDSAVGGPSVGTARCTSRPAEAAESRALSLRPYQRKAVGRIFECLAVNRSTLLVLATAGGKTTIFGEVAKLWRGRVLVLAHREELLDQARKRLEVMCGEPVGLEQAEDWAGGQRIVVGSVPTLGTGKAYRRERFQARPFSLVIVDEAHHAPAKSYRKVLDTFPDAKVLGVTATPDRGDEQALGQIFESVAYKADYLELADDGWLVPVNAFTVELGQVDLRKVDARAGDFAIGALDKAMQAGHERVVAKTLEMADGRKTIVFVPGVEGAHMLAATFNRDGRVAVVVDGKTPKDLRRDLLAQHARGEVQVLVNVGIATEGYDCPGVACVAIARPTKSRALYAQMAGRGARVLPDLVDHLETAGDRIAAIAGSGKPDLLLLDFVGQAGRHKLVSPIDILGGVEDPEILARARRLLRKKPMRPADAVALAKEEAKRDRERREASIRGIRSDVRAGAHRVDPFGRDRPDFDEQGQPFYAEPVTPVKELPFLQPGRPMSSGLRWALGQLGYSREHVDGLGHEAGVRLLRREKARQARGLAPHRIMNELGRYGVRGDMYRDKALALLAAIGRNGGKPLAPAAMDAILRTARTVGGEG